MKRYEAVAACRIVRVLSAPGAGADRAQVRPCRRAGSLFDVSRDRIRQERQCQARRQGQDRRLYGSSQLGGDKEMLQKLKLGTLDFALPSTVMSSEVGYFRRCSKCPTWSRIAHHMVKIEKEIVLAQDRAGGGSEGLKILAIWENGYRHITNNKHPIQPRPTCRASSCACPKASGGSRCSRPTARTRAR